MFHLGYWMEFKKRTTIPLFFVGVAKGDAGSIIVLYIPKVRSDYVEGTAS
jgi:hypothetical protein